MKEKKRKLTLNHFIIIIIALLVVCFTGATIITLTRNNQKENIPDQSETLPEKDIISGNYQEQKSNNNISIVLPEDVIINNPDNTSESEEETVYEDFETLHEPIGTMTLTEKHEYLGTLTSAAESIAEQYGVSLNVMLAIALYNSNWGENDFADFNNPVGFLAERDDDYIIFTTYEGDDNNQMVAVERKIKTYERVEECFVDLALLMKKHGADKQFDDLEDLLALSDTEYVQSEVQSAYAKLLYELSSQVGDDINLDDVENYELIERGEND